MGNKTIILFVSIFISVFTTNAQFSFKDGFVITQTQDTLFGKVKDLGAFRNSSICIFKSNKKEKAIRFQPEEIKAFMIYDEKYFESHEHISNYKKPRFLEVMVKGDISLYYDWKSNSTNFFIKKEGNRLIDLINEKFVLTTLPEQGMSMYAQKYTIYNQLYKDSLQSIFNDSKKTLYTIRNLEYNQKSFIDLTTFYLDEKCARKKCYSYTKDLYRVRSQFGIYGSVRLNEVHYLSSRENKDGNIKTYNLKTNVFKTYPIGVFYNFPLKLIHDNLVLQFEAATSKFKFSDNDPDEVSNSISLETTLLEAPVLLRYVVRKRHMSPTFGIGASYGFSFNSTPKMQEKKEDLILHPIQKKRLVFEIGADYKISKTIYAFSNIRLQSNQNLIYYRSDKQISFNKIVEEYPYPLLFDINAATLIFGLRF